MTTLRAFTATAVAPIGHEPVIETRWQRLVRWLLRKEKPLGRPIYPAGTRSLAYEIANENGTTTRVFFPAVRIEPKP